MEQNSCQTDWERYLTHTGLTAGFAQSWGLEATKQTLLSKLNWSRSLGQPCEEETEVSHDSLQCLVGTGITLQRQNHLKGTADRLVANAAWSWEH